MVLSLLPCSGKLGDSTGVRALGIQSAVVADDCRNVKLRQIGERGARLRQVKRSSWVGPFETAFKDDKGVSGDQRVRRLVIQADMPRRVAGRIDDQQAAAPGKPVAALNEAIDAGARRMEHQALEALLEGLGHFRRHPVDGGERLVRKPEQSALALDIRRLEGGAAIAGGCSRAATPSASSCRLPI